MINFFKNLKFVWRYAKEEKRYLVVATIVNILCSLFQVVLPIVSAKIIISLTESNFTSIIMLAIAMVFINFFINLFYYVFRRCAIRVYQITLSNMEIDLGNNILKVENNCLDKNGSGVFIQRLTNDTSKLANVFNSMLDLVCDLFKYIGILVAIFIVNKIVFIYVVFMLICLYILEKIRTDRRKEDDEVYRKSHEKVSGFIGELVRGARDIKMLNSEDDFVGELDSRIKDTNEIMFNMQKRSYNYRLFIWNAHELFGFILIILLVILMEKNIIVSAIALVLYNYVNNVHGAIYILGDLLEQVKDFNLSAERIIAILKDDEFKKEKFGKKHLDLVNGDFEFKNVYFSFGNKTVLRDMNFRVNANETVAFVGKSGAGKTTIFNLLCKMYDVSKGSITIDGVNIKELDKDSIRGNITIISQNPYIFNMSIRDNLRLVKSDLTDKEMIDACKLACLDDFINELPDKYDTIIGEGGVNLSGGQKQRLAIARALVQKTEIILFDEATSALDNETQSKIQNAIENMKNEYTILIIAHRLSTIINCDRIIFIEDGHVICEGSHKYLLKNCREYKELYDSEISK